MYVFLAACKKVQTHLRSFNFVVQEEAIASYDGINPQKVQVNCEIWLYDPKTFL